MDRIDRKIIEVIVSGGDMSAEEREKVILAVGNVEGVAAVEADTDEEIPVDIISLTGGGFAVIYKDNNENTGNKDDYFV